MNNKIPYLVENKERDTFTIYVKGTKPYLDLQEKIDKAIQYIKNKPLYSETYDYNEEEELEIHNISDLEAREDLLEILGDKE